jgi:uncharacterized protein (DUF2236 family)
MAGTTLSTGGPAGTGACLPAPGDAVTWARRRLARQVTGLLTGEADPVHLAAFLPRDDEPGFFGPNSVTWRVHADPAMLVGGVRALMLQTMHPLAMAGVEQHSYFRADPLGRLANTSRYLAATVYGTAHEARKAVAAVKRVHQQVVGVADDGRPYAANDPHLLAWIHHCLVDSFLRAYDRYGGGRLSPADADRYIAEQAVLADLFGAEPAARSVADLAGWMARERPQLRATPAARRAIQFLLIPPLPLAARPPYTVLAAASVTMLPRWVRSALRLPVPPVVEPLLVRPAATTVVRAVGWVLDGHVERPAT